MDEHPDQGLTLQAAALRSGKSVKTLRRWIKTGRLPTSTVTTGHGPAYRIAPEDLERAIAVVDVVARQPAGAELVALITAAIAERDAQWLARLDGLEATIAELARKVGRLADPVEALDEQAPSPPAPPSREGDEIPRAARDEAPSLTSRRPSQRAAIPRSRRWWEWWRKGKA